MTNRAVGVGRGRRNPSDDTRGQDAAKKLEKSLRPLTAPVRLLKSATKTADKVAKKIEGKPQGSSKGGRVAVKPKTHAMPGGKKMAGSKHRSK